MVRDLIEKWWRWGVVLAGMALLVSGGVVALRQSQQNSKVEIISDSNSEAADSGKPAVVVDVSGAVERPGVYKLNADARVNDALVAAGGVSQEADRVWLARYLNLAQMVPDGAKIYIPKEGEGTPLRQGSEGQGEVSGVSMGANQSGLININTAGASELDSLWGIGEKRAADIVANRPYQSVQELVSKAKIPQNIYDRIKNQVTAN